MAEKLKIVQMLCPKSRYSRKCPYTMKAESITIHNTSNDAPAKNEVSYMIGNSSQTSFHYAVDDKQAVQGILTSRNAWHAGDGNGRGNRRSISIEICYSKSGGARFDKAEKNAAYLTALLLKQKGWGISRVKRHRDWSGKNCPHRTISRGWKRFLNMVQKELDELNHKKLKVDGSWGRDTTRAAQRILKTTVDGEVSNQPAAYRGRLAAADKSSWEFKAKGYEKGSSLIRAIQKLVGTKESGLMDTQTVKALQSFLKKKGFYSGIIGGGLKTLTVKAFQKYLNSRM